MKNSCLLHFPLREKCIYIVYVYMFICIIEYANVLCTYVYGVCMQLTKYIGFVGAD